MNSRYREIHRAEIKRRMFRFVDRRWDAVYGTFGASIVLVGAGVRFCLIPRSGACFIGAVFLIFGALFFAAYLWLLRILRTQGNTREWLKPLDQIIMAVPIGLVIALPGNSLGLWFFVNLMVSAYATWRLWQNSRPLWRTYYFRAGRDYFREIKSYSPNNAVKRDALQAARPLP